MSEERSRVRPYRPGDETAIQRAFSEVFQRSREPAEWRWKFLRPPRGSRIELGFDPAGDLLAQYAAIVLDVAWQDERLLAGQIVDVFSRHRGGLGRRSGPFLATTESFLARCRQPDGLAFVYGFPGDRHQRLGKISGLYNETAEIERLTIEAQPRPQPVERVRWLAEGYDATASDTLWRRAAKRYPVAVVRDAAWVRWRYAEKPGAEYVQLAVRRLGEPRAWGVLATSGAVARWLDLVWDGEDASDLALLEANLRRRAHQAGAERVELWLRGDRVAAGVLRELGWRGETEPVVRLGAIVFAPPVTLDRIYGELYLTMGDCDHF